MYALRQFAIRHARGFELVYEAFEGILVRLDPVLTNLGYERLERPVAALERLLKGLMFDCQMCGQCVLSSTGMSCPMNCPKNLRNGPCGGVRPDGMCEVKPRMRCVWMDAWEGAARMQRGALRIQIVQPPVNRELEGSSSWLRAVREKAATHRAARPSADPSKQALADAFGQARDTEPAAAPLGVEPRAALAEQAVAERTTVFETEQTG